jgi:hypothetical protein
MLPIMLVIGVGLWPLVCDAKQEMAAWGRYNIILD